jgi:hypothetical protein
MNYKTKNNSSFLDNVRRDRGISELKNFFKQLYRKSSKTSLNFINNEQLQFPTLFILKNEILKSKLFDKLNERNKAALSITNEILMGKHDSPIKKQSHFDYVHLIHSTLKWMLESGLESDGINDEYDRVMDIASAILVRTYKDKTILPLMADTIFKRCKNKRLVHDMVWAFSQAADPQSLMIIGEKLLSSDKEDVEIASKLLNFIPDLSDKSNGNEKYNAFLLWMEENSHFLKFTGESFQQCSNPNPYKVVCEGKYLCKDICCDTGHALIPPSEKEYKLLEEFKMLDEATKILLSNFSFRLHHKNIYLWSIWINCNLEDQIKIAKVGGVQ